MVTLFVKFSHHTHKLSSKMKQHHDSSSELLSSSFRAFESNILSSLHQISMHSKHESKSYSVSWIQTCLQVLPNIDKAFTKFIAEIDYPVTEWKGFLIDEYLKDNLSLLDNCNSISSSISHMSQACMKLLHDLSLTKSENLRKILPWSSNKRFEEEEEEEKGCSASEKELIVHKALLVRMRIKNWVCRVIDSSIRGDVVQPCLEMKCYNSSMVGVCEEMKRRCVVKEVAEINKGVVQLLQGGEANELREKVEVLGKLLEGIKEDVNRLFSEGLLRRNELLDSLRKQ